MLSSIMSNARASERFLGLARDLDVMAPRTPEEVQPKSVLRPLERCACGSTGWRDGGWTTRPSRAALSECMCSVERDKAAASER